MFLFYRRYGSLLAVEKNASFQTYIFIRLLYVWAVLSKAIRLFKMFSMPKNYWFTTEKKIDYTCFPKFIVVFIRLKFTIRLNLFKFYERNWRHWFGTKYNKTGTISVQKHFTFFVNISVCVRQIETFKWKIYFSKKWLWTNELRKFSLLRKLI